MNGDPDLDGDGVTFVYDATVPPAETRRMLDLLTSGAVEVLGLMPWSSNGTFLAQVRTETERAPAVYKPERGERPLWDFPPGLWRREVAAFELSELMGLGLVPPTVGRREAPLGPGSLQAFVPARFEEHYFTLREKEDPAVVEALKALCVFDLVANATDRKGGHCILDEDDRVWAIDNGLSFHRESKLRTVIWDFAGEPIPDELLDRVRVLRGGVPDSLGRWLEPPEAEAVVARAAGIAGAGRFPVDPTGRRHPWPIV